MEVERDSGTKMVPVFVAYTEAVWKRVVNRSLEVRRKQ